MGHSQPLSGVCVTCNLSPLFSICFKPQDFIIRILSGPNSPMVRGGLWILWPLSLMAINRYRLIVNLAVSSV